MDLRIEVSNLQRVVGERAHVRGRAYAEGGRVLTCNLDPERSLIEATVLGSGAVYTTHVRLHDYGDTLSVDGGSCSCPVGVDCKHVVAAAITAASGGLEGSPPAGTGSGKRGAGWQSQLDRLIEFEPRGVGDPLAIELELHESRASVQPQLRARLMRPGAKVAWVNDSLDWELNRWSRGVDSLRPEHLDLARQLRAIQRLEQDSSYSYYRGGELRIDLTAVGKQIWPLLEEAQALGMTLISAATHRAPLGPPVEGRLSWDVTAGTDGSIDIATDLEIDGDTPSKLRPRLFIGRDGHGVVCERDAGDGEPGDSRIHLIKLERPAAPEMQRMVLDDARLEIPAEDVGMFRERFAPALGRTAALTSSDDSFEPPEVSAPSLVLEIHHLDGHRAELAWAWAYTVEGSEHLTDLGQTGIEAGFRDPFAEAKALEATRLEPSALADLGLTDEAGRPRTDDPVATSGTGTLELCATTLPELQGSGAVELRTTGEPAAYREVGEQIEIGVSTAEIEGQRDWFDLEVSVSIGDRQLPFSEVFVALAAGEDRVLLEDGSHFSLREPRLQSLRSLIEEARALSDAPPDSQRISRYQAGLWEELVSLGVVEAQASSWRRQAEALVGLADLPEHEPPDALTAELRPYQREGFAWLAALWELDLGAVLADDMGLGKTLQALALVAHARVRKPESGPFLVLAPRSVLGSWATEAARFAPGLNLRLSTSTLKKAGMTVEELAEGADVVVTSYNLFRLEAEVYASRQWGGLVLDEAQFVKNHQSKTYRAVRELACPFKLALTGTPMENNLGELWSLLSITAPGLLGDPKAFAEHFARPIERDGDGERLAALRQRMKPLMKRRTKEMVATDLPPKQEQLLSLDLLPRHRKIYDRHLQRERQKILGLLGDFDRNRFSILSSITKLRQLSLHAGLVEDGHQATPSAKLEALGEHLEEVIAGGHRALVFSQFTTFLTKAREMLEANGVDYCYLDGSTRKREQVISQFKEGTDPAFLISLKAGGFGLNLTEANCCFLLDPWWNPAVENQAIDRTHRIGQTSSVNVYRMVARETIEEKVVALAQRKSKLFDGVIDDGELFASAITADDIRGLLE